MADEEADLPVLPRKPRDPATVGADLPVLPRPKGPDLPTLPQAAQPGMPDLPVFGPLPGTLNLLSDYDSLGKIRPLGPREYLKNPDGSWSSEMSVTVQMPDGSFSVVPSLWLVNGVPHRVDEDTATQYAQQSGLVWPQFATQSAADDFANLRESRWQRVEPGRSDMQPPLWQRRWPPPR